jgi:4-hydroxymandelate oxidase
VSDPVSVADFERLAEERVPEEVWCYFAGGAGDEVTLRAGSSGRAS